MSSTISIYINLLKTILGCGILKYPYLVKEYGIISCTILTLLSALCSFSGILIYIELNDKYKLNNTLSSVTKHFSPKFRILSDIVVIFKCYIVSLAYLIYIKNQLYFLTLSDTGIYFFIVFCFIEPLVIKKDLKSLRFVSVLGLFAVCLLLSTSIYKLFELKNTNIFENIFNKDNFKNIDNISDSSNNSLNLNETKSNTRFLKHLSSFVFSFTCHQNIFTIQNEMIPYNKSKLQFAALMSFLSSVLIYLVFGITSFLAFGNNVSSSFIDSLSDDDVIKKWLSIFYILILAFSVPLQTLPCKQYIMGLFMSSDESNSGDVTRNFNDSDIHSINVEETTNNNLNNEIINNEDNNGHIYRDVSNRNFNNTINNNLNNLDYGSIEKKNYYLSIIIATSLYLLARTNLDFDFLCKFVGGTFSTFMCFIFAGLFYLLSGKKNKFYLFLSFVNLTYGSLAFVSVFI